MSADLRAEEAAALCVALAAASSLTSLDLAGNLIGVEGALALAACLPHTQLKSLAVADNVLLGRFLSDKERAYQAASDGSTRPADCGGVTALLRATAACALQRLDLSYNHLGDEGAAALADAFACSGGSHGGLSLLLGFSKLTPAAAQRLAAALRRPCGGGRLALGALDLRNNTLQAAGAAALARSLAVSPDDGATLAVARLSLMNNHVGIEGARAVAAALSRAPGSTCNPFLRELDLSSNCLGAGGVAALAPLLENEGDGALGLHSLLLHRNNAGDEGTAALCVPLAKNTHLRQLRLSNNHVHSAGAMALAEALKCNAGLLRVDLTRNHFTTQDEHALRAACAQHAARELLLGHGPI